MAAVFIYIDESTPSRFDIPIIREGITTPPFQLTPPSIDSWPPEGAQNPKGLYAGGCRKIACPFGKNALSQLAHVGAITSFHSHGTKNKVNAAFFFSPCGVARAPC